jgi:hypothetical protein
MTQNRGRKMMAKYGEEIPLNEYLDQEQGLLPIEICPACGYENLPNASGEIQCSYCYIVFQCEIEDFE